LGWDASYWTAETNEGGLLVSKELMTAKLSLPVTERDHTWGATAAFVTLVEYGDYSCIYCAQTYLNIQEIKRWLGDELRFVFRNFPMSRTNPNAQYAAEAAEAAAAQGRFWEMHNFLFQNQKALHNGDLARYAERLGLDVERFEREIGENLYQMRVREDFMSGVRSGVYTTPRFFINGVRHDDSCDFDTLLDAIKHARIS
jgi:protein-disulfide isomerase